MGGSDSTCEAAARQQRKHQATPLLHKAQQAWIQPGLYLYSKQPAPVSANMNIQQCEHCSSSTCTLHAQ